MYREKLIQEIKGYQNRFSAEVETAVRFIDFVSANPNCFERTLKEGHVTGSAWVVNGAKTHVLLTHHRKLNKWLQLGGHADGEGDVLKVALREAQEESGIKEINVLREEIFDLDIHLIPERGDAPAHYHYDLRYRFQVSGAEDYVVSDESHDLAWVEVDRIEEFTNEASMLRMARKWKALQ